MKIEKLDHYGRGITRNDEKICFVEDTLKDEDVEIEIIKNNKKYQEAIVRKYNKKSKLRVEPKCKYYNICGGCQLSHLVLEEQNKFKERKVEEIIYKYGNIKTKIMPLVTDDNFNYRNKVTLHIKNSRIGFYKNRTNEIIEIEKCLLLDEKINNLIKHLKKLNLERCNKITIKLGNKTNEIMLIVDGVLEEINDLLKLVDVLIINDKVLSKKDYIISVINDKKYKISKNSFFQVNKYVTEKLYNEIKNQIKKLDCRNALDLYCGTGTIGIYISDIVNKVIGIEVVNDAIEDAKCNAKINNIENIKFIKGKVEDKINNINEDIDTIILDPPRSGLHNNVIEVLKKIKSQNIIYVSCDPMTLARDINKLKDLYEIEYIKPFDMFPNTYHVECVCVMKLR